ncbi:Fe-S cluster assembly ATPase SufC [Candidatus Woesebacteria bacterium]|nr:Fe-S cluster assembly ATPase SufC [Candidatus Woesebacteria bacterium]
MNEPLLSVTNLQVTVDDKVVVDQLSLELSAGETAFLMGANGSGKSSLANVLLGNKEYRISNIEEAKITFDGKDLLAMTTDERAKAGLFVAWQNPVSIPGVSVFNLCKSSYEAMGNKIDSLTEFKKKLEELAVKVGLTSKHIVRNINEGFSGGEKKRLELLQLLLLKPKLVVLDEIDSGIDSEGIKMTVQTLNEMKKQGTSVILITHNKRLLDEVQADHTWEMKNGRLSTRV